MPSPIGHSVTGYALSKLPIVQKKLKSPASQPNPQAMAKSVQRNIAPLAALYSIVVSNLPDLDFLPQLITGIRFHRGPSHSLLAALLVSTLLAWIVHRLKPQLRYPFIFSITFILYGAHLFLDLFTSGGSGIPLLWPLFSYGFSSPIPIFPAVHHSLGLLDKSHLIFVTAELLYALCLIISLNRFKRKTKQQSSPY